MLLLPSLSTTVSEDIEPKHGFLTIVRFGHESENLLVSDNEGPIDVFDLQSKTLTRSYLEHSDRITGIDWAGDGQSFMSTSKDGTVRFYNKKSCLLYTSPSPRDATLSRMPSSA